MTESLFDKLSCISSLDWHYAMSDDPRAYRAGKKEVEDAYNLFSECVDIDPEKTIRIWNENVPKYHKKDLTNYI